MDLHTEDNEYLKDLLDRFENASGNNGYDYFDFDELEDIIYYYFEQFNYAKASKAIEYALNRFPADDTFTLLQVQNFLNMDEPEKALAKLNSIIHIDPTNSEFYVTRAHTYSLLSKHQEAIKDLEYALTMDREDLDDIHFTLAIEYQFINKHDKGIFHFKKALEHKPNDEGLLFEIGLAYDAANKFEEAVEFFNQYVDKNPFSFIGWYQLAIAYGGIELFEKAIEATEYSIAIEPSYIPAYYTKANCYEQMDMNHEAIAVYKSTFEVESPNSLTLFYIGECYVSLSEYEMGIEWYRKSIAKDRNFADSWMGISVCYAELNKPNEALSHIEQAIRLEDDNADYYLIRAEIQKALFMNNEAFDSYKISLKHNTDNEEAWLDYSDFVAKTLTDYNEAISIIENACTYFPGNVALIYRKVAYLLLSGRKQEALVELHIALIIDVSQYHLLLEYDPSIANNQEVISAIDSFLLKNSDNTK